MFDDRNFHAMINAHWNEGKFLCVGLDSEFERLPPSLMAKHRSLAAWKAFNIEIVNFTLDLVCAYKINSAFYEAKGAAGISVLKETMEYIRDADPSIPIILDGKRADIGNTNRGTVQFVFEHLGADAVTVNPYPGFEALEPFLSYERKGIIVLCRTSNPGAGEFQDLVVGEVPLFKYIAHRVTTRWNEKGNCLLVMGATYPGQLREVRELVGDIPFLIPGIGTQGGDLNLTIDAGQDSNGKGMIINASSAVIFASSGPDYASSARQVAGDLHKQIQRALG